MSSQIPPRGTSLHTAAPTSSRAENLPDQESEEQQTSVFSGRSAAAITEEQKRAQRSLRTEMGRSLDVLGEKSDKPLRKRILTQLLRPVSWMFGRSDSYSPGKAEFRSIDRTTLWQKQDGLPNDKAMCRQISIDSALSQFPYEHNYDEVKTAMKVDAGELPAKQGIGRNFVHMTDNSSGELKAFMATLEENELLKGRLKLKGGLLHDTKSGLVFTLFRDRESGQVKLVFGGTTGGKRLSFLTGKKLLFRQVVADAVNFSGPAIPKSYRQAGEVARLAENFFGEGKVSLTGHSMGGGLAQFAGAMHRIPATCFSSAALGKAALVELAGQGRLDPEWIKDNITQVMVKGDPISNPLGLSAYHRSFAQTNLGSRIVLGNQTWRYGEFTHGRHVHAHEHVWRAVEKKLNE